MDLPQVHLRLRGPGPPAGHDLKAAMGRLRQKRHRLLRRLRETWTEAPPTEAPEGGKRRHRVALPKMAGSMEGVYN